MRDSDWREEVVEFGIEPPVSELAPALEAVFPVAETPWGFAGVVPCRVVNVEGRGVEFYRSIEPEIAVRYYIA